MLAILFTTLNIRPIDHHRYFYACIWQPSFIRNASCGMSFSLLVVFSNYQGVVGSCHLRLEAIQGPYHLRSQI